MIGAIVITLGAACIALAIWLGIRIINRPNKRSIRLYIGTALVLIVMYPLSFGPACWIATRRDPNRYERPLRALTHVYEPLIMVLFACPETLQNGVAWYLGLAAPPDRQPYFYRHATHRGLMWNGPGYTYTVLSTRWK